MTRDENPIDHEPAPRPRHTAASHRSRWAVLSAVLGAVAVVAVVLGLVLGGSGSSSPSLTTATPAVQALARAANWVDQRYAPLGVLPRPQFDVVSAIDAAHLGVVANGMRGPGLPILVTDATANREVFLSIATGRGCVYASVVVARGVNKARSVAPKGVSYYATPSRHCETALALNVHGRRTPPFKRTLP